MSTALSVQKRVESEIIEKRILILSHRSVCRSNAPGHFNPSSYIIPTFSHFTGIVKEKTFLDIICIYSTHYKENCCSYLLALFLFARSFNGS